MSDPQNPVDPQQQPASQPPAYQPPQQYPGAGDAGSGYAAAPPAPYGPPATATVPGKTMGIVAFILSFFVQLVALILGIIALVQSRKAGHSNGWAVAAIIISSVLMVIGIIVGIVVLAVFLPMIGDLAQQCAELGPGRHELPSGITITCG